MAKNKSWFDVDKEGLRKLVASEPAWKVVAELLQNAWDEDCTEVRVMLTKLPGRPAATLVVEDDNPEGFRDLSHAFTLFASNNTKHQDPEKRGRFNMGEKLVLARCIEAEVSTTKGTVVFNADGTRTKRRAKTEAGTVFTGTLRMNAEEFSETCNAIHMLQPPVQTWFNGELMRERDVVHEFETTLPTVIADDEGVLRTSARKTNVRLYTVGHGETAHIYEMGIPIVETGDTFHVDVQQKVPLNMQRDNVTPAYLRKLRAAVLNNGIDYASEDDLAEKWVDHALEDPNVEDQTVRDVIEARFGKKVCSYDPSDTEANNTAVAKGYTLIHGRSLSADQWKNVRRAEALRPAGQVCPTDKPNYQEGGEPEKTVPEEKWTPEMHKVVALAKTIAEDVLGFSIHVILVNDPGFGYKTNVQTSAWYGGRVLHFNYRNLGKKWFRDDNREAHLRLIIHELAHEYEMNHLSMEFQRACCRIGAKVTLAAADGTLVL